MSRLGAVPFKVRGWTGHQGACDLGSLLIPCRRALRRRTLRLWRIPRERRYQASRTARLSPLSPPPSLPFWGRLGGFLSPSGLDTGRGEAWAAVSSARAVAFLIV